jgi:Zn finger protein HypA/HybF involved in hydrogenase expression
MTVAIQEVTNSATFGTWLQRTNDIVYIISTNAVTADSSYGGQITTGNAAVNGYFAANNVRVKDRLGGGNSSVNSTMYVFTNTNFGNSSVVVSANVWGNVWVNETLYIANNTDRTSYITANSTLITFANTTSSANVTPIYFKTGISTVNTIAVSVGANVIVNSTAYYTGNDSINSISNSINFALSNGTTSNVNIASDKFFLGNSVANSTITGINHSHKTNTTAFVHQFLSNTALNDGIGPSLKVQRNTTTNSIAGYHGGISWMTENNSVSYNSTSIYLVGSVQPSLVYKASGGHSWFANGNFNTTGTEVVTITNTFNVGIGNTVPTTNLSVNGTTLVNTSVTVGNSSINTFSNSTLLSVSNSTTISNLTSIDLTIGNTIANSTYVRVSNSTATANLTAYGLAVGNVIANTIQVSVGANVVANDTGYYVGNSTANIFATATLIRVANSTNTANLSSIDLKIGTSVVNTDVLAAGANVIANTTAYYVGNSTANIVVNSTLLKVANSTNIANLTAVDLKIGTSVVNTDVLAAGANVIANTTAYYVGNSTSNITATSTLLKVANSTNTANLTAVDLTIGTSIVNTVSLAAGANVIANTTAYYVGNSTSNTVAFSTYVQVSNSTISANLTPQGLRVGNTTLVNAAVVNAAGVWVGPYSATTNSVYVTNTSIMVSSWEGGSGNSITNAINNENIQIRKAFTYGDPAVNVYDIIYIAKNEFYLTANQQVFDTTKYDGKFYVNATAASIGNTTANSSMKAVVIQSINSTSSANVTPAGFFVGNSVVNTTYVSADNIKTLAYESGNSTANMTANSTLIKIANGSGSANLSPTNLTIGTSVVGKDTISAGANVIANTTAYYVGNSSANAILFVGNSTVTPTITFANSAVITNVTIGSAFFGNSTANTIITSNSVTVDYITIRQGLLGTYTTSGSIIPGVNNAVSVGNSSFVWTNNYSVNTYTNNIWSLTSNSTVNGPLGVKADVSVNGSIVIKDISQIISNTYTFTTTDQAQVDRFAKGEYRSAEYVVQCVDTATTSYQIVKLLVVQDGTNAYITEYGSVNNNGGLVTFVADVSGSYTRLMGTPTTNAVVVKFTRIALAV